MAIAAWLQVIMQCGQCARLGGQGGGDYSMVACDNAGRLMRPFGRLVVRGGREAGGGRGGGEAGLGVRGSRDVAGVWPGWVPGLQPSLEN